MAKKTSKKAVAKKKIPSKPKKAAPAAKSVKAAPANAKAARPSWLDADSHKPVIDKYARQLESFMQTMADGKVDDAEIEAQEASLTKLMKEIEPLLDDDLHKKVTRLLCELTAYDLMQMLHQMQQARPATQFVG